VLPSVATDPTIALDPLAVVGFTGALLNALNLLPIGRLDGGRVSLAVLGNASGGLVSGIALLLLGISTFFTDDNPIILFFGLFIIFLQRSPEIPAEDDLTGVSQQREIAAAAVLLVVLLTLIPFPVTTPGPSAPFF